jgi:phosphatidylethanolamine-binding protein (PEBP) family uncharacterized protein
MIKKLLPGSMVCSLVAVFGCSGETGFEDTVQMERVADSASTDAQSSSSDQHDNRFHVRSPNFHDGDALHAPYTCSGNPFATGVSPELDWNKGPKGTKSYAIVLHDVSLSDPNLAYHWAAWNIPSDVRQLPEGIPGLDPADPSATSPYPAGLGGGQQVQARNVARYFAPCPDWIVVKAAKCDWPEPRPVAAPDSYTFTVYALPVEQLDVPAYNPAVDSNYAHQLDAIFAAQALGSTQIGFTSDAVPSSIADNGPFNCSNPPLPPAP